MNASPDLKAKVGPSAEDVDEHVNFEAEAASPSGSAIIQLRPVDPEKETIIDDPTGIKLHSPSKNRELLQNQNQFEKWGVY